MNFNIMMIINKVNHFIVIKVPSPGKGLHTRATTPLEIDILCGKVMSIPAEKTKVGDEELMSSAFGWSCLTLKFHMYLQAGILT